LQRGDLSNAPVPRILVIYDNLLAKVPEHKEKNLALAKLRNDPAGMFTCYEIDQMAAGQLLRICLRDNVNVTVVTWMDDPASQYISDELEYYGIPVRNVIRDTPYLLAQRLSFNPDVTCVYDPDPEHVLLFGSKGYLVTRPQQIGT
jgi:hypothetical protein